MHFNLLYVIENAGGLPLEALKAGFRRACIRRLVGDEASAINILKDEIPGLVVGWSKSSSLEPPEKKAKLKELFDDESSRADELSTAFDLFSARFEARVVELVKKEVGMLSQSMNNSIRRLDDTVHSVDDLAKKLKDLEGSFPRLGEPLKDTPEGTLSSVSDDGVELDEPISLPNQEETEVELPIANEITAESEQEHSFSDLSDESNDDTDNDPSELPEGLDPPSGIGLRFDEIEEMIDEIVFNNSSTLNE